ncbi:MAG: methyltransferase domain-containing protein [Saprospiraceae bacterium]|nr:methyltransferase domain-containing protein [Saprospiraceae bacterium]
MKKWKKILSYIFEFHVETTSSEFHEALHVSYSRGRYQLSTQNAIYSFGDLYTNYYQAFEQIDLDNRKVKNVLILGFGLGSIPMMLEQHFHQNYNYTAVEIDEEVLYLAHKYVTNELNSPIETICTDAAFFVQQCDDVFDIVCVDLFLDDIIPDVFQQQEFLKQVKTLIAPKGILLYNRLALTKADKAKNETFLKNEFLPIFPKGRYLDVDGNWMFLNN